MATTETCHLQQFFGLTEAGGTCRLYLPSFSGPASLETGRSQLFRSAKPADRIALRFPGHTFADRDAKAAFYVTTIISRAMELDNIRWEEAGAFTPGQPGTAFLFGSRSNQATEWATGDSVLGKFFHFKFQSKWSICAKDLEFSLPAPDGLTREEYEQQTDYGVIGRFREPVAASHVFLIAGLGARATEGCAYHLTRQWEELARRFCDQDFAIVLKFSPPIDPRRAEEVAAFD